MATIAKLDVLLGLKGDAFDKGLQNSRNRLNSWGESMRSVGTKMTAGLTVPLVGLGIAALNSSSSLEQAQGKVDAVFKDSAGVVQDWSKTTTNAFGISQTAALQSAGTMGNFFTSAGLALDISAQYSTQLVELSGDMAAFNDVSASRATEAIISGMAGEYDSLQRLGVNITAAKVETEALAIATADGREEITEADLALARYNVIMEESRNQHGQAAREYDNFSSKLARMQARLSDLAARWGDKLMPVALDFLDVVEDLLGWVEDLSPAMQRWAIIIAAVAAAAGPLLIALGLMLPGLAAVLGIVGALLSPLGLLAAAVALLAYHFRDELGAALDWIVGKIQAVTNVFNNLREVGISPAQAALMAIAAIFPELGAVIAPLRQLVENLGDAFAALRAGDYAAMFDSLGAAARNVGSAILGAIRSIDWSGIAASLWDGIQGAAAWVGQQTLNIPSIAVSVGRWVAGKIADVWDWLTGHVFGGHKGDGTGGATDPGFGGVTVASVVLSVLAWAEGTLPDAAAAVLGWLGNVAAELAEVALSILAFDPTYDGTAVDKLIENMIGEVLVTLSSVAVKITGFKFDTPSVSSLLQAAVPLIVGAVVLSAVPISVPVLLTLGAITLGLLFSFAVWQWAADWARANPVEAVEVLVNIALALGEISDTIGDLAKLAIEHLVPGGSLIVQIPTAIEFIMGDGPSDEDIINSGAAGGPGSNEGGAAGGSAGGGYRMPQLSGGGIIRNIMEVKDSIASALDGVKTDTIQPRVAEWGAAVQAGLAPLGPISAVSFGAVNISATTQLGAASASVAANTSQMNASSTANLGAMAANGASRVATMAASVTSGLSGMRGSAISTVSSMGSSVGSSISTMSSTSSAQVLGMKVGIAANMLSMQSSAVSNANSMKSGVVSAAQDMALRSASAVSSGMGAIPGIISSIGGSAAATARAVGANIGNAMAAGMLSALGAINSAANQMVAAAETALRARAMIASPSRLFARLGGEIGEGFAQGIEGTEDRVARATAGLVSVPGLSGADGAARGGVHHHHYYSVTPEDLRRLIEDARAGGTFARQFADELGMRGGQA